MNDISTTQFKQNLQVHWVTLDKYNVTILVLNICVTSSNVMASQCHVNKNSMSQQRFNE